MPLTTGVRTAFGLLHDVLTGNVGSPIARRERRIWAAARTLEDLCDLTARWLCGELRSQPGYYGPCDVDQATNLLDALVALNDAGVMTYGSQEGYVGPGYRDAHIDQHAAFEGFCTFPTLNWLSEVLNGTRFQMAYCEAKTSRWCRPKPGVPVTFADDQPVTRFGSQLSTRQLGDIYDGIGDEAFVALCDAVQVVVWDIDQGANDLWPHLMKAADRHNRRNKTRIGGQR